MMSQKRYVSYNLCSALIYQLISIISSFILPALILNYYGSDVNGLVNSITQFLSYITMLDLGVGAVFQSALYKPLAMHDMQRTSAVFCAGKRFYRSIGFILCLYLLVLIGVYPLFVRESFDLFFTVCLILSIAASLVGQFYFGITYQLFLSADQHAYVQTTVNIVTLVINTVLSVILIKCGCGIIGFKLITSLVFLMRPLVMRLYVERKYNLDRHAQLRGDELPQKWNGLAQHVATVVLDNTDIALLTVFSSLRNVSVYTVYFMIVSAVKQVIALVSSAFEPTLGNIYGEGKYDELKKSFTVFEWIVHNITVLAFSLVLGLIIPFVRVYTDGITDANYIQPIFGYMLAIAQAMFCFQLPYKVAVKVFGHYKQTQFGSFVEVIIKIIISVVLVLKLDLVGVAIGTFCAMTYRYAYLVKYVYQKLMRFRWKQIVKLSSLDFIMLLSSILLFRLIPLNPENYIEWFLCAFVFAILELLIVFIFNLLFNRTIMFETIKICLRKSSN